MYVAKLRLKSIGDGEVGFLTFKEGNSYKREDVISRNIGSRHSIEFENRPTSGWKLSHDEFTPIGNVWRGDRGFFLQHPDDENIRFLVDSFDHALEKLTIIKGIIQEQIIFVFDGSSVSIVVEGEEMFDIALSTLDNERSGVKVTPRNLNIGDVIIYEGNSYDTVLESVFLGSYFVSKGDMPWQGGGQVQFSKTPKKMHLILHKYQDDEDENEVHYRIVIESNLKNISLIGFKDGLDAISYPDLLNEKVFNSDIELFRPLCGEKILEYSYDAMCFANHKDEFSEDRLMKAIESSYKHKKNMAYTVGYNGRSSIGHQQIVG